MSDIEDAKVRAREFLDSIGTLTLATSSDDTPWAATVFFAADKDFNIYFVSDHRTQHGRDMAANESVSAAINPDVKSWDDVAGLQVRGKVSIVDGMARAKALAVYLMKFPQIDALYAKPQGEHEETIAARLKAANFYKIKPAIIRVIDNEQGFGWREEFIPR